jgi:hypothetical protein
MLAKQALTLTYIAHQTKSIGHQGKEFSETLQTVQERNSFNKKIKKGVVFFVQKYTEIYSK